MKNVYWIIFILSLLYEESISKEVYNLISHDYINLTDSVKVEENKTIKFDCQSTKLGCSIAFKKLNITHNTEIEIAIKMRNTELFDDINNAFGIWYNSDFIRFLEEYINDKKEDSNEFIGYYKKFKGSLLKVTDKNSKLVLFNNNGEDFPKTNVFYDKALNVSQNKEKGIKFCDPVLSDGKLSLRLMFLKNTLIFQVLSKNSWKFCFSTDFNYEKEVNLLMSSRMFKESFFYEITNFQLSRTNELNLSETIKNISMPTIKLNNYSSDSLYKDKVFNKLHNIKDALTKNSLNGEKIIDSDLQAKLDKYLKKLEEANKQMETMTSDIIKLSNSSYNEDNINSFDQREISNKLMESLKNETEIIKQEIDGVKTQKDDKDDEVKKVLLSSIDNLIKFQTSIDNSINLIDSSIISVLQKIEEKSTYFRRNNQFQYMILICLMIIFIFLIYLFKRLTDNPVIMRKKVDHEKLFDSIV